LPSGFPSIYAFSKTINPPDYDPTYPKNPNTLTEHIRKFRKENGLLIREFANSLLSNGKAAGCPIQGIWRS
jgi:hypothetical protein